MIWLVAGDARPVAVGAIVAATVAPTASATSSGPISRLCLSMAAYNSAGPDSFIAERSGGLPSDGASPEVSPLFNNGRNRSNRTS